MILTDDNIAVFTPDDLPADQRAIQQLRTCLEAGGEGSRGVLCADHHVGYSQPIGGAVAYENYISPSGVGYDIGCGNMAVSTSLMFSDVRTDLPRIMDEITRRISFGMGRPNNEPADHPVIDKIRTDGPIPGIRQLQPLAAKQLGTVGSGNHYIDLFREEGTDRVWIGVHFGSRGFGHKIASGFLAMAQNRSFSEKAPEGEMDSPPILLDIRGPLGYTYIEAMKLAGEYAYAGRELVVAKVLEILGNPAVLHTVHNHHNFAWLEDGAWVIRKGCTPLWPGQQGFVGGSMGENAVIIEGNRDAGDNAHASLFSAPHGAGRVMSRTEAKGKSRKRWYCENCGWEQRRGEPGADDGLCPVCMHKARKRWIKESEGKVDWKASKARLRTQGIILVGGDADEAPEAYKRLPDVLSAHAPYVKVVTSLRPIGVAMAGEGVQDPFKD